jgi:hypothetical protein
MEFLFLKIILRGDTFYKLWSIITKIGKLIYTFILGIQAKYLFFVNSLQANVDLGHATAQLNFILVLFHNFFFTLSQMIIRRLKLL